MSTLNDDFRTLQSLCADILNRKSDYLMRHLLNGDEMKIIETAIRESAFRRDRQGLKLEDAIEREQELASQATDEDEDELDYGDGPYAEDGSGMRFRANLDYSQDESGVKWVQVICPHLYNQFGTQTHYLEFRAPRSALFDALEIEIKKYLADKGDYDEYELDREGYEAAKHNDKVEMAKRVIMLLHDIGEAHYLHHLRYSKLDEQEKGVLGYSHAALTDARNTTRTQMKAMLLSNAENRNLHGELESIQGLLQRMLGAEIFAEAAAEIYRNKRCLDSFDFLNLLKTSPRPSLSM